MTATNAFGANVLHVAAQGDAAASIVYFLEKSKELGIGLDVDSLCNASQTPLHSAANYGCELAAVFLITNNAYVNAKDNKGQTPLHLSIINFIERPNIDCFKKLLLNGAERNIRDKEGKLPIDHLMELKEKEVNEDDWSQMFKAISTEYGLMHCL